jgi:hypothetical protein
MQICLNSPLPSFDGIMASFRPLMTWPPKFPSFPKLPSFMFPSLPSPLFPSFSVPNFELMIHGLELQAFQLQTTIMAMIKPILSKLGIALSSWLPKIPGLPNLNLIDLLSGSADKMVAAIRSAILNGFRLPGLPFPFYVTLKIPDFEVIQTIQILIANYMAIVAKLIPSLIKTLTDKFKWPGLPKIPSLPSMEEIMSKLKSMLPEIPRLPDLNIMALIGRITFPGLPAFPNISLPMMFSFKMPDIEFNLAYTMLLSHLTTGFLKPILDFILNTLSKYLSFTFPKLCVDIPVPSMPKIEVPTITLPGR